MTLDEQIHLLDVSKKISDSNMELLIMLNNLPTHEMKRFMEAAKAIQYGCSLLLDNLKATEAVTVPDPAELDRLLSVEPEDMNPAT